MSINLLIILQSPVLIACVVVGALNAAGLSETEQSSNASYSQDSEFIPLRSSDSISSVLNQQLVAEDLREPSEIPQQTADQEETLLHEDVKSQKIGPMLKELTVENNTEGQELSRISKIRFPLPVSSKDTMDIQGSESQVSSPKRSGAQSKKISFTATGSITDEDIEDTLALNSALQFAVKSIATTDTKKKDDDNKGDLNSDSGDASFPEAESKDEINTSKQPEDDMQSIDETIPAIEHVEQAKKEQDQINNSSSDANVSTEGPESEVPEEVIDIGGTSVQEKSPMNSSVPNGRSKSLPTVTFRVLSVKELVEPREGANGENAIWVNSPKQTDSSKESAKSAAKASGSFSNLEWRFSSPDPPQVCLSWTIIWNNYHY